ncbi:hypothetical protein O181_037581 [Austropuccinia psidii MF-1]|uniref:Transposase domain-containing protein n=1 Tax=Austropuccinia psidii MF-1 TaxID=1389203 RepID=A0A9Q3D6H0_9BASI|nr:hypothetical protein [Austropuccinia psidii MF-1]
MEICNCSVCKNFLILDENLQQRSGRYLSIRNAAKHWLSDLHRPPSNPSVSSEDYPSSPNPSSHSTESDTSFDIQQDNPLGAFIILFILWLHLFCNVSLENCTIAIKMIINILNLVFEHRNTISHIPTIPRDPRTLIKKAHLDVELTDFICCRQCFHLYKIGWDTPLTCSYKQFSTSECCNEELFVHKPTFKGNKDVGEITPFFGRLSTTPSIIGTPRCLFVFQRISTWLRWLLSRPDTECLIDQWIERIQLDQEYGHLTDIQHGSNFKNIVWKDKPNSLKLALSLFVDWFNPRGNKLSGKVESMGIFAISCVNLPPTCRNKLSHMCIFGIMPGPYAPNPQTLNHLLKPLVDELIELDSNIFIPTYQYPAGRIIQVKLLSVYGDILATKKVVGFASHSATQFCSFCHVQAQDLSLMQLGQRRMKNETISAAHASKNATNKNAQDKLLRSTGIRWSELNRLSYWDPSQHVILGIMHNWLEGILQCHFRYRWKFRVIPPYEGPKKRKVREEFTHRNKRKRIEGSNSRKDFYQESTEEMADESSNDILIDSGHEGGLFSQDDIQCFQELMKQAVLPPGIPHLPSNLGESKHGKLSAAQWHALFVYIIPLVIFEIYVNEVANMDVFSNRYKLLMNTAHLIHCSNIVCAHKIKEKEYRRFQSNYQKYTESVAKPFNNPKVQPNHHFALHIPEQMEAWGPLSGVAEFGGERLIGFLQKINTNNRIDEMHKTMMVRGCRLQRLIAKEEFDKITKKGNTREGSRRINMKKIRLIASRYMLLFDLCLKKDPAIVHRDTYPVPQFGHYLSGFVEVVQNIDCKGIMVGCSSPCNCVVAKIGKKTLYGVIKQCYRYVDHLGEHQEAILLVPIKNLFSKQQGVPTSRFRYMLFLCGVVLGRLENGKEEMIDPSQVVSLAAYRLLKKNTLSIEDNGIILVPQNHNPFLDISGDL